MNDQPVLAAKIAAFILMPLLVSLLSPVAWAQPAPGEPVADQVLVHLNLQRLGQSKTGKLLAESVGKIPFVKQQLAAIPENLEFLTSAQYESVTLHVSGNQQQQTAVFEVLGKIDTRQLFEMLSHANGYTKVQFAGVDVHHWVTDFDALGDQFMGQRKASENPLANNQLDSVYLANPRSNRIVVSTSLARLTEVLSGEASLFARKAKVFDRFGEGDNLVSIHAAVAGDEIPGELTAVIREDASSKLLIHAALRSRNESERQAAESISALLGDPGNALKMFAIVPNPDVTKTEMDSVEVAKETKTGDSGGDNQISLGFQMNSATQDQGDWTGMVQTFLKDCVRCQHSDDTLTLDVSMFLGPCRVTNVAKDSDEGVANGQGTNQMKFTFNVYTTKEQRRQAQRVAEKQETETKRR